MLDDGVDQNRQRCIEVGVGEDDLRRLAAEFEGAADVVARRGGLDLHAGLVAADEGDEVDIRMAAQRRARLVAVTGDHVDRAFRESPFSTISSAMRSGVWQASSAGFMTTALPIASAGPTERGNICAG